MTHPFVVVWQYDLTLDRPAVVSLRLLLSDQLLAVCIKYIDHVELRRQCVNFLQTNPAFTNGHTCRQFIERNYDNNSSRPNNWDQYVTVAMPLIFSATVDN